MNASYAGRIPVTPPVVVTDPPGFNRLAISNIVTDIKRRYEGPRVHDMPADEFEDL